MRTQSMNIAQLSDSKASSIAPAFTAALIGLGLIFLTGFLDIEAVHNAAHDTRHSAAFPCH